MNSSTRSSKCSPPSRRKQREPHLQKSRPRLLRAVSTPRSSFRGSRKTTAAKSWPWLSTSARPRRPRVWREKAYRTGACDFHLVDAKEEFAARFPLSRSESRRDLREGLPPRHVHRAAADRAQAGRDRARNRLRRARARLHRQGQRSGPLRARVSGARAAADRHRAVARVGHRLARRRHRLRIVPRHPRAGDEEGSVLARPQPLAPLARRRPARRSVVRAGARRCSSSPSIR